MQDSYISELLTPEELAFAREHDCYWCGRNSDVIRVGGMAALPWPYDEDKPDIAWLDLLNERGITIRGGGKVPIQLLDRFAVKWLEARDYIVRKDTSDAVPYDTMDNRYVE